LQLLYQIKNKRTSHPGGYFFRKIFPFKFGGFGTHFQKKIPYGGISKKLTGGAG
jgi:hypothetical protein